MIFGVFEFRIELDNICVSGFEFSEKSRFVFLLMSLPGSNYVKNKKMSFLFDVPAGGKLCITTSVVDIFQSFAVVKHALICLAVSLMSMLELLVWTILQNAVVSVSKDRLEPKL